MIKELRIQAGYTQERLAEELDFGQEYVSRVERGIRKPSWRFLVAFANLLRISPEEILRRTGYVDIRRKPPTDIIEEISDDPDAIVVLEFLEDYPQQRRVVARFIRDFLKGELEEEKGASGGREPGRSAATENTG